MVVSATTIPYRPEIDGLRALAVVLVIFFHAGSSKFQGGYVGVDVFFVISGYLITSIIWNEHKRGQFTYAAFYERRARRILPALYAVTIVSVPLGWYLIESSEYREFVQSAMAVPLFLSNVFFWSQSGYFADAAELKPLLHTWSLAVEEQFYLIFPPLLLLLASRTRHVSLYLAALLLASLALSQWMLSRDSEASFFLLPTRLWELLVGALLALGTAHTVSQASATNPLKANVLGVAGLALILVPAHFFGETTPFPGVAAIAPTLGAALVIYAAWPGTFAHWLLSQRIFVGIGLISYSLYLWHQPLFAFGRMYWDEATFDRLRTAFLLAAVGIGWLSWKFIEKPFRDRSKLSRAAIFATSLAGAVALLGVAGVAGSREPRIVYPETLTASFARSPRSKECFDIPLAHREPARWNCRVGKSNAQPSFMVFGDSHAVSLLPAFDSLADATGEVGLFAGFAACPPVLGVYTIFKDQERKNCHDLNMKVFAQVKAQGIKTIFLVARWVKYTTGGYRGPDKDMIRVVEGDRAPSLQAGLPSFAQSRKTFAKALADTVATYTDAGIQVVILHQVPQQLDRPRRIYLNSKRRGGNLNEEIASRSVPITTHLANQVYSRSLIDNVAQKYGVDVVDFDNALCRLGRCLVGDAEKSYYRDDNHLSVAGALNLVRVLQPHFKKALVKARAGR